MSESNYLHSSHNVSNLLYHFVTPTKYRRLAINDVVEKSLKEICVGIELRWDWIRFLEVGADKDHVHFLIQSTPNHSPSEIIRIVKSVTAKRIFAEHPEVKMKLWGGNFWSEGYFVATVGRFTSENVIAEYVRNQGEMESYKQLYLLSRY
ncbi:MAG: IS200/IS605 family transposase [Prevotella sp.]